MGLDLLCIAVLRELGSAGTRRDSADPQVPTKEGLTVELDVALLFHVRPEKIREIYLNLGMVRALRVGCALAHLLCRAFVDLAACLCATSAPTTASRRRVSPPFFVAGLH